MTITEGFLKDVPTGAGPFSLYFRRWTCDSMPTKAIVLLVHGLGEHCGRYDHVAASLNARGYAVYALDHAGHGKSDGARVCVDRFSDFEHGLTALMEKATSENPDCPIFAIGHSMGGCIVGKWLLTHQHAVKGAILSGPAVMPAEEPNVITVLLGKFFSKFFPRMGLIALDTSGVSRDPAVVAAYLADPLVHSGKITARLTVELLGAMSALQAQAQAITIPLFIMHGGDDRLTAVDGSKFLEKHAGSADKRLKIYPGLYHEIFNEPEQETVLNDVGDWLDSHL